MPKTKAQLNKIAKNVKYLKSISTMKLTKEEKGYVHSMAKYHAVKIMKKRNIKKYGR